MNAMKIFMKKEKVKPDYSIWLILDSLIFGGIFFISPLFSILCTYYIYFFAITPVVLIFLLFGKSLYDKNRPRSDKFRKVTAIIRSVVYSVVIISFSIPFLVGGPHNKPGYPVRRAMFLSHYSDKDSIWYKIMPERLPDKSDDYSITLLMGFGPGTRGVDISYYTDSSVISEYKRTAQEYGAEYYAYSPEDEMMYENGDKINEDKIKFIQIIHKMRNVGVSDDDIQNSEIYIFLDSGRPFFWILNEQTGYFRAYALY